jgi:hypothetical protein
MALKSGRPWQLVGIDAHNSVCPTQPKDRVPRWCLWYFSYPALDAARIGSTSAITSAMVGREATVRWSIDVLGRMVVLGVSGVIGGLVVGIHSMGLSGARTQMHVGDEDCARA